MESLLRYNHHQQDPEVYDRLCAFNLYWSHGYDTAVDVYPDQAGFLWAHLDKTLEEIRRQCYGEDQPD